jgi:SAM-dependent methyltransferase
MSTEPTPTIAPPNAEQRRAWDGDEGAYWAAHPDLFDDAVRRYRQPLLAAAGISATDDVLDIGCGTGQLTRDAAGLASTGSALGIDLSSRMLDVARVRADEEGLANASFVQADAQTYPFPPGGFDVVVSRTGAMFFEDPVAAFENIGRGVRPGGRLALMVWQPAERNEWFTSFMTAFAAGRDLSGPPPGAPSPFALADPERVRQVLGDAGWTDTRLDGHQHPMYFGPDASTATAFVSGLLGWLLEDLDAERRRSALEELHATMAAHQTDQGVGLGSAAWIITAERDG